MPTYDKHLKTIANNTIKYLYQNMPEYNQLKGTYTGIQMILNLMGLCTSITELWSPRTQNALQNFLGDEMFRADELDAVRQRIADWGNATVKDYFLTSRFDVDIKQENKISFKSFNSMASTIISTILQMKPVTRCLRYLYYIITINTDIHFEYLTHIKKSGTEEEGDNNRKIENFRYKWDVVFNPLAYKSKVDKKNNANYSLFLPWIAERAAKLDLETETETNTLKNTYFNLYELDRKFQISKQKTFRFKLEGSFANPGYDTNTYTKIFNMEIGKDVDFQVETNGILVNFKGSATSIFLDLFGKLNDIFITSEASDMCYLQAEADDCTFIPESAIDTSEGSNDNLSDKTILLSLTAAFSTVLGSKYLYQNNQISLDFPDLPPQPEAENITYESIPVHYEGVPLRYV